MKNGNQQCNTPNGHVRKHITALEASPGQANVEASRRVIRCHNTPARPADVQTTCRCACKQERGELVTSACRPRIARVQL